MIPDFIDPGRLKLGENRMPCPVCDKGPKDTALSVRLEPDGGVIWCCHRYGCPMTGSSRAGTSELAQRAPTAPPQRVDRVRGLSEYARQLLAATRRICGEAGAYLDARGCVRPPPGSHLRCMDELRHPSGFVGPALVALITDAETGERLSLHRTWIKPNGTKADLDTPRLLLKGHPIAGGVIRLWPDEGVTTGLGIAEGIETALSLAHGFAPVWSCIDASHMAKFPVLSGINDLVIGADNDAAGRKAAEECAQRWADHATVRIVCAERAGSDLNDEVREWAR